MIVALDRKGRVAMPAEAPVTDDIDIYCAAKLLVDPWRACLAVR